MIIVRKHPGRSDCCWKTLLETDDKDKAMSKYISAGQAIKRGTVELLIDGVPLFRVKAPVAAVVPRYMSEAEAERGSAYEKSNFGEQEWD